MAPSTNHRRHLLFAPPAEHEAYARHSAMLEGHGAASGDRAFLAEPSFEDGYGEPAAARSRFGVEEGGEKFRSTGAQPSRKPVRPHRHHAHAPA